MDSTASSGKPRTFPAVARSSLEGACAAAAAAAAAAALLPGEARDAAVGLGFGWLVSAASFAAAAYARGRSPASFVRAYLLGALARALVLAGLMASVWTAGPRAQAARLSSYVAIVVVLLLMELRHIKGVWISTRF